MEELENLRHRTGICDTLVSPHGQKFRTTNWEFMQETYSDSLLNVRLRSLPNEKIKASILIGNSDDKLTQKEWMQFNEALDIAVCRFTDTIFFDGASNPTSKFQNRCLVVEIDCSEVEKLEWELKLVKTHFKQEAIAIIYGETRFL